MYTGLWDMSHPHHTQGNQLHISCSLIFPSLLPRRPGLGKSYRARVKKSTCLQCFQSFAYLTPRQASKRKGRLSQQPIREVASLSMLLLARAATPNTPLEVSFWPR